MALEFSNILHRTQSVTMLALVRMEAFRYGSQSSLGAGIMSMNPQLQTQPPERLLIARAMQ